MSLREIKCLSLHYVSVSNLAVFPESKGTIKVFCLFHLKNLAYGNIYKVSKMPW